MSERPPHIARALTEEELRAEVQKNSELSPEEQQANRLANIQKWQHQPTITLNLEEMRDIEEKKKREERKGV